jgi:tetratricopeptide (TPR) repeat protein
VWSRVELGDFDDAMPRVAEALALAAEDGDPHHMVAACWAAGYLHRTRGELAAALERLEHAHDVCHTSHVALWRRPTAALLGHACALAGRDTDAIAHLEDALIPDENAVGLSAWRGYLAEAHLLAGRIDDAARWAALARELASARKELGFEAHATRLVAAVEARNDRDAAVARYAEALAAAEALAMRPLMARCHRDLAALHRARGDMRLAAVHGDAAERLARTMKLVFPDREDGRC